MRSHYTDGNTTYRTTSVGPAALIQLWKIFSLIYWVNVHRLQYSYPYMCIYTHTQPHLCKPGMVNGLVERPFYCVVMFESHSSVYCNQSASDYFCPSEEPAAVHHPNWYWIKGELREKGAEDLTVAWGKASGGGSPETVTKEKAVL